MTNIMHKLTAMLAAGAMALAQMTVLPPAAAAIEPETVIVTANTAEMPDFSYLGSVGCLTAEQTKAAAEAIYCALMHPTPRVPTKEDKEVKKLLKNNLIGDVDLTQADEKLFVIEQQQKAEFEEAFRKVFNTLVFTYREAILVRPGFTCLFGDKLSGKMVIDGVETEFSKEMFRINGFHFYYLPSVEEADWFAEEYQSLNAEIDSILAKVNPDWSDAEKALFFHEYLSTHYNFDFERNERYNAEYEELKKECEERYQMELQEWEDMGREGPEPVCEKPQIDSYGYECFSARDLLHHRMSVCQGYSWLYSILMNACGIRTYLVKSEGMNHTWNYVLINGEYYHVDVTWDDQDMTQNCVPVQLKNDPSKGGAGDWLIGYGGQVDHCRFLVSSYQLLKANAENASSYVVTKVDGKRKKIYHKDWITTIGRDAYEGAVSERMTTDGFWNDALGTIYPFEEGWIAKKNYDLNGSPADRDGYCNKYLLYSYDGYQNTSRCVRLIASEGNPESWKYRKLMDGMPTDWPARNNFSVCCVDGSVVYYTTRGGKELHFVVHKLNEEGYEDSVLLNIEEYGFEEDGFIMGMYIDGKVMRFQLTFSLFDSPVEKTIPLATIHELLRNRTSYAPVAEETTAPSVVVPIRTEPQTTSTEATTTTTETTTTATTTTTETTTTTTTTAVTTTTTATTETTAVTETTTATETEPPSVLPPDTIPVVIPPYMTGYLNGGKWIQLTDIVKMVRYINGNPTFITPFMRIRMDMDGDGQIDIFDLALMKWTLLHQN